MCVEFSHSLIVQYLINNLGLTPNYNDIKKLMKEKDISVKIKNDLAIFNYSIQSDFNDPIVKEARGIIINLNTLNVVCWGFDKFFNYNESYVDNIDWNTAQIQAKIDGSIVKLYYYNGIWHWATNGCIDACDANTPMIGRTFQDVIELADNFNDISYDNLDKNKTYIFELVSPETRVVVEYDKTHLYHLGTRSNVTGLEFNDNIGIEKPHVYNIADPNLEKVIEKANHLNNGVCEHEGFVVCDANYNRIKVKNPAYLMLHHSLTKDSVSKESVVEAIVFNDEEKILALLSYPHFKVQFKYYDWQVTKFLYELDLYITYTRNLYSSLGNRKDFALKIKDDNFKAFGFMAIDNVNLDAVQMVRKVGIKRILKFIKD